MIDAPQRTLDGSAPRPTAKRSPLTRQQLAVLAWIGKHGSITSTQAGVIVHGFRPMPHYLRAEALAGECPRAAAKRLRNVVPAAAASDHWPGPRSTACCPWATSDGGPVMHRLRDAGLVVQHPERRGTWVRPDEPDTL